MLYCRYYTLECLVRFTPPESEIMTLLKHGFWPATPSHPGLAASQRRLDEFTCLTLESQVSLQSFLSSIEMHMDFRGKVTACRRLLDSDSSSWGKSVHAFKHYGQKLRDAPFFLLLPPSSASECPACPKVINFHFHIGA